MSGFSSAWLGLRAAADERARSRELTTLLATWLTQRASSVVEPRVVDLACGTGANCRYLAPLLPLRQRWSCVDHDAALLRSARDDAARTVRPHVAVDWVQLDLAAHVEQALTGGPDVITASALLDLVSAQWLLRLVAAVTRTRAAMLFVLSVDGRMSFAPGHGDDELVRELFAAHQQRDKGFGAALGARAVPRLAEALTAAGHAVQRRGSDWLLAADRPDDAALLVPLLEGIAAAACEQQPAHRAAIKAWLQSRLLAASARELHVCIGHEDLLALPR